MKEKRNQNVEELVEEYRKDLEKLFQGEGTKSFDAITTAAIGKVKNKLQQVAEETADVVNKKKRENHDVQFVDEK